jgi:hypothetical protein
MTQGVEHLPCKCDSNPNAARKKKEVEILPHATLGHNAKKE